MSDPFTEQDFIEAMDRIWNEQPRWENTVWATRQPYTCEGRDGETYTVLVDGRYFRHVVDTFREREGL